MNFNTLENPGRILGTILIIAGSLVGIVIIYVMRVYYNEGEFTAVAAIIGAIIAIILLVLPQLAFGIYLLRQENHAIDDNTIHSDQDKQTSLN